MKIFKIAAAIAALLIASHTSWSQTRAEVQVSGLTCSMCQLATEKSLKTLGFIGEIKPNLNTGVYTLIFKKGQSVDLDQIKSKVKSAGFSVSKLVVTLSFDQVAISNNFHYRYEGKLYHFMNVAEKTLDGEVKLTVINKDFIPAGDFKKYAAQTTYSCYKSGVMGKDKVVHVTI
ncbi:heavy-metal-associated domain-containing protein [Hufsiella ginkgonis]|uniref:HMA domain-containing protein n=1 Tax=Hufsiella ginkgonis TaxID=2695274 RepID=A0A7K1XUJ1_9SPHI|nr:cation transporter [Hufsiella ginkgonis]MXV14630.1 hypothetical protein [Hufsiella ginkgonis]